jgi:aspartyl-tRNA(Asn)/glutamyl-tRNA(Gln) amidotransferase subunit C
LQDVRVSFGCGFSGLNFQDERVYDKIPMTWRRILATASLAKTPVCIAPRHVPLANHGNPIYLHLRGALFSEAMMSVDADTVRRIAHLARIAVAEQEVEHLKGELNAMLAFVEQLQEVNVEGVEPMTSVTPMEMKKRPDAVTDGGIATQIVKNAPANEDNFFLVPKVVE